MIFTRSLLAGLAAVSLGAVAAAQPYRPTPPAYGFAGPPPDWQGQQDEARQAVREGRHVPLGQVLAAIRARTPGRQLDAGLERGPDGRPVYRVRWAGDNGRRIDYTVDAESGAILGAEGR